MSAALEIDGIHKSFGNQKVLDGFSLRLEAGEILGLLGPNGCGKSTVLNMICKLLLPDAGQISLMGQALHQMNEKERSLIGFCTQRCALYPDLFPAENLHNSTYQYRNQSPIFKDLHCYIYSNYSSSISNF
jgi:ABC-type multidrug transport system ATPase subunit